MLKGKSLYSKKGLNNLRIVAEGVTFSISFLISLLISFLVFYRFNFSLIEIIPKTFKGNNIWDKVLILGITLDLALLLFYIRNQIRSSVKLLVYSFVIKKTKKAYKKLKTKINNVAIDMVESRYSHPSKLENLDMEYAEILNHVPANFNLEGVVIDSIHDCIKQLRILMKKETNFSEIIALTNLKTNSWLSNTMLIYLFQTLKIADSIPTTNRSNCKRVFIRGKDNTDDNAFEMVKDLHDNVLNIIVRDEDIIVNRKKTPSFLYIKSDKGQEYFWSIKNYNNHLLSWESISPINNTQSQFIDNIRNIT